MRSEPSEIGRRGFRMAMVILERGKGGRWRQDELLIAKICWSGCAGRKDNIKAKHTLALKLFAGGRS